ncbi:NACHT and WD repeat domain-containing protein [Kitasatospora sp. NPDC051853]|uniref:NACHT and WD repeat domain-containing protein n=1 Tax=Kitasatospora sp. NPDC051853 TaxID=3364058 RepID=UPI00379735FD
MNSSGGTDGRRHVVLTLGIALRRTEDGDSPRLGLDVLAEAPEHAERVARILEEFRYTRREPAAPAEDTDHAARVEAAVEAEDADVLIVHVVAHGELATGSSEKLYVLDQHGNRLPRPVGGWIDLIEDHPDRHRPTTLFVLDVCYAGQAAVTAWHARMDVDRRRAWVLAATGPDRQAFGYRLSRALVQVLEGYRDLTVRFDPSLPYIPPTTVWRDVDRAVGELAARAGGLPQSILTSLVPGHADLSRLPFFPNPSYDPTRTRAAARSLPPEIARLADWAADPLHFMRRAGGAEPVARDWSEGYFSGRTAQLDTLTAWLDEETAAPGLRVVTGKAGAGKSALLGVLLCAAHPALRRHTRPLWAALDDHVPGENDRLVAVHARRLGLDDIAASLARQLRHLTGAGSPAPDDASGSPAQRLLDLLRPDDRPVTIVIDALDEALNPQDVLAALLLPLARHALGADRRLRLLVATREDHRSASLLDLARATGSLTDLSTVGREEVRHDVAAYAKRLLSADGPYSRGALRDVRTTLAETIADTLTTRTGRPDHQPASLDWGEFLTAGLYVHHLLAVPPATTHEEAVRLGRAVPRDLPELLELDLRRHTDQPHLRPVLTALAFAQGRGTPEGVLAHAAAAFTADGAPLPLPELYALLDGVARFYLRRDIDGDGTTLYRLFHEGLADWLRQSAGPAADDDPSGAHATGHGEADRLLDKLLDCVPRNPAGLPRWQHAAGYLLRHTAQHAVDAGRLDELLDDVGYLQHADPHTLAEALPHVHSPQAQLDAAVYRASWGVHHGLPPAARRQVLALDAARLRDVALQRRLPGDADWTVHWATGSQISPALVRTLTGHTGAVRAVAATVLAGRPHIVTGDDGGALRVWDAATGTLARELTSRTGAVHTVALPEAGRHAVTVDDGGALRLWNLATGLQVRELTGHTGRVTTAAAAMLEEGPRAVTGTRDGRLQVWDLSTGALVRELDCRREGLTALTLVVLEGGPRAVTGDEGGTVRLWDLATGTQTDAFPGHAREVHAVAVGHPEDGPYASQNPMIISGGGDGKLLSRGLRYSWNRRELSCSGRVRAVVPVLLHGSLHAVSGSDDGSVQVWDLNWGHLAGRLAGHTGAVNSVGLTMLGRRPHAVTGSSDGSARVWDLATGTRTDTLTAHTGKVLSAAVVPTGGHPHAVTGDRNGTVVLWDLGTGTALRQLTGHTGAVNSVALLSLRGHPHAVTAGGDRSVRLWDLTTGAETARLAGHTSAVSAVAVAFVRGRALVLTGAEDGLVRVWDLAARTAIARLPGHRGRVNAVAVVALHGREHVVSCGDDGTVRVRDLATGARADGPAGGTGRANAVALTSPGGRPHVVGGGADGTLRMRDLTTGALVSDLAGHDGAVTTVAAVSLGRRSYVLSGSADRTVRVWDPTTSACLTTFHFPDAVNTLALAPDGTVVVGFGSEVAALSIDPLMRRLR